MQEWKASHLPSCRRPPPAPLERPQAMWGGFFRQLSIYLCIYVSMYLSISIYQSIPIYQYLSISTYLSVPIYHYLSISIYLSMCLSISTYLSVSICSTEQQHLACFVTFCVCVCFTGARFRLLWTNHICVMITILFISSGPERAR